MGAITADTHPPEYLLHRYWARKPHNVLAQYLRDLVPPGGRVVDPFCGSGIFLSEAVRAGFDARGFDVNPVAVLMTRVTLSPPPRDAFVAAAEEVLAELASLCAAAYGSYDGAPVRYVVHETVVPCPGCGARQRSGSAVRDGRIYRCGHCNTRLHLNLRHLASTEVTEVVTKAGWVESERALSDQQARSAAALGALAQDYSQPLPENRRILSHDGMQTSHLFTVRNFWLLSHVASRINQHASGPVQDALLLMLTATVPQCSRLIAYRGRMTTGGPAWTVPGFWVPPVHLEANPLLHLAGRMTKFIRGITRLHERPPTATGTVQERDGSAGLAELASSGEQFDLVFFDPPYGDSVPYLEFSALYNSFLGRYVEPAADLSVSDRVGVGDAWGDYSRGIGTAVEQIRGVLRPAGKLLVTFNSHDDRAWRALFRALQNSGFRACSVSYQLPAVVPAKAQFAPDGSYIGDFYCVYTVAPDAHSPSESLLPIRQAINDAALARRGVIPRAVARRAVAIACIEVNLSASLLSEAFSLLDEMKVRQDGQLVVSAPPKQDGQDVGEIVLRTAREHEGAGSRSWTRLCTEVADRTSSLGIAGPSEVLRAAQGAIGVSGKLWHWTKVEEAPDASPQMHLEFQ